MTEYPLSGYALTILSFGAIAFGLYLLIKGGDWTIDAAVHIAQKAGLSQLFIGATIVAFGTSVPELFTSVNANLSGFPGLSVGNIVGSNIANILLIIGATAVVFALQGSPRHLLKDMVMVGLATVLLMVLMVGGLIERWHGVLMTLVLLGYIVWQFRSDTGDDTAEDEPGSGISSTGKAAGILLGGLAMLAVGSEMLVQGAVAAGTALGVPEAVIGLTVVAFGTSLPELSTCLAAAIKRHTNIIIGNILGSNLFNILWIIGFTALTKPLIVGDELTDFDMWFMGGVTLAFAVWMLTVSKINRPIGAAMVAAYVAFIAWSYQSVLFGEALADVPL